MSQKMKASDQAFTGHVATVYIFALTSQTCLQVS